MRVSSIHTHTHAHTQTCIHAHKHTHTELNLAYLASCKAGRAKIPDDFQRNFPRNLSYPCHSSQKRRKGTHINPISPFTASENLLLNYYKMILFLPFTEATTTHQSDSLTVSYQNHLQIICNMWRARQRNRECA